MKILTIYKLLLCWHVVYFFLEHEGQLCSTILRKRGKNPYGTHLTPNHTWLLRKHMCLFIQQAWHQPQLQKIRTPIVYRLALGQEGMICPELAPNSKTPPHWRATRLQPGSWHAIEHTPIVIIPNRPSSQSYNRIEPLPGEAVTLNSTLVHQSSNDML